MIFYSQPKGHNDMEFKSKYCIFSGNALNQIYIYERIYKLTIVYMIE